MVDANYFTITVYGELDVGDDIDWKDRPGGLYNYGTVSVVGELRNIDPNEVEYYNYAGSVSNWGGGNNDQDLQLYADYDANLINYNRAGDQT